jgi:hypothetical protein
VHELPRNVRDSTPKCVDRFIERIAPEFVLLRGSIQ